MMNPMTSLLLSCLAVNCMAFASPAPTTNTEKADGISLTVYSSADPAGFDIASVPDPTDEANLEIPSGRGLLLMREYMSLLEFIEPGNRLRMIYRRVKS